MSFQITFPDGNVRQYDETVTLYDIADSISHKLAKNALAGMVNGKVMDLSTEVSDDAEVRILTWDDDEGKDVFRHSSSHLMAEAVKNLYPDTKFGIGPAIKDGFYYDFDSSHIFTEDDFEKIEKEMARLAAQEAPFINL